MSQVLFSPQKQSRHVSEVALPGNPDIWRKPEWFLKPLPSAGPWPRRTPSGFGSLSLVVLILF